MIIRLFYPSTGWPDRMELLRRAEELAARTGATVILERVPVKNREQSPRRTEGLQAGPEIL